MIKISDIPIISLDLETGGLIPGKHTPLSIGAVVVPNTDSLLRNNVYEITEKNSFYVQLEWDTVIVDPQAMRINELDIANPPGKDGCFDNCSLPADQGLRWFSDWLSQYTDASIHALGVNVGSFDLPMLRSIWQGPGATPWPFHYRSIDLNSLFFALSQIQNKPFDVIKKEITDIAWNRIKQQHTILINSLGVPKAHHALADAWSNVYIWEECLKRFQDSGGGNDTES